MASAVGIKINSSDLFNVLLLCFILFGVAFVCQGYVHTVCERDPRYSVWLFSYWVCGTAAATLLFLVAFNVFIPDDWLNSTNKLKVKSPFL